MSLSLSREQLTTTRISYLLIYGKRVGKIAEVAQSLSVHFRERLLVKNSADIGRSRRRREDPEWRLNLFSERSKCKHESLFLIITR